MTDPKDAPPVAVPVASASIGSIDATTGAEPDDRTARRTALRDLAAMIGVEVFY